MGLLVRQLVDSNPGVVAILQRIISNESKNVTVPSKVRAFFGFFVIMSMELHDHFPSHDVQSDPKGVANFQAFIKDNYNDICLELIAAGYRVRCSR